MVRRLANLKELLTLGVGGAAIFAIDLLSPPTLLVSIAYAGLVLLVARPGRIPLALFAAALSSALIAVGLVLKGQFAAAVSDAAVSGLLAATVSWMAALIGSSRSQAAGTHRIQFAERPRDERVSELDSQADIVKLTEVQRALLDRLNLATQTAGLAIWDRDLINQTVYVDDSFARLFGVRSAGAGFEAIREVVHPDDLSFLEQAYAASFDDPSHPTHVTHRFRIIRETDRALRHVQVHRRLFRGIGGRAERIIGVAWDVTDEVQAAQALIDATEAAQAASRAKSALLANVSHEIRTPMNGIIGMTALLLDGSLHPAQRDCAETIRSSADSLLHVIDDILDFSKIEAGRMEVEVVATDPRRTIDEVCSLMSFQVQQKKIDLRVEIADGVSAAVMSDPQRLRQCLVNLIGNAVKFTHSGAVTIALESVMREGHLATRFEVRDTGIGIAAPIMKQLFEPFVQADSSTTRNFGGTGLGLSIVKRFVEMMNGTVGVSSDLGQGSTFWFELPAVATAAVRSGAAGSSASTEASMHNRMNGRFKGRVLLVEDNSVNQKVARKILERLGCDVRIANNGAEAVEISAKESFDIMLMDMQMPIVDGLTATALIRQRELGKPRTPIVALTANAMNGEYERCMAAGMDAFLTKPISVGRLCEILSGFGLRAADHGSPEEGAFEESLLASATKLQSQNPIDLRRLAEISDGDSAFLKELLETFFASANECLEEIARLLSVDDRHQLARAAHRLKGAAANIHASPIADLSAQLEHEARTAEPAALLQITSDIRRLVSLASESVGSTAIQAA